MDPISQTRKNLMRRERILNAKSEGVGKTRPIPRIVNKHTVQNSVQGMKSIVLVACPFLFCAALVEDERYLLEGKPLPTGENVYAVGQWSCWVATTLILIATYLNSGFERSTCPERKKTWEVLEEDHRSRQQSNEGEGRAKVKTSLTIPLEGDEHFSRRESEVVVKPLPVALHWPLRPWHREEKAESDKTGEDERAGHGRCECPGNI
jgi:hypothetical protein